VKELVAVINVEAIRMAGVVGEALPRQDGQSLVTTPYLPV